MWQRIELRNYRSIEYAKVDLAPFTVLVGPNGSGKSNFADAFVFVRDIGIDAATAVEKRGGISGIRRWSRTKPYDVTIDMRVAGTQELLDKDYIRHKFTIHSVTGRWNFRDEIIEKVSAGKVQFHCHRDGVKLSTQQPHLFPISKVKETTSAMLFVRQLGALRGRWGRVRKYRLNPDAMRQPQPVTENARLDEAGNNIAAALRRLQEDDHRRDQILTAMGKIVPGLDNISAEPIGRFLSLKFTQWQAGEQVAAFSGTEISEGALRALGIVVAAYQMTKDELTIVEEPEVNIHVGAAALLFETLKQASKRGAVLITTHSADLLDAARDEEILVCEYRDGITKVGPLASAQRSVVRQGLFSVAELMRSEPLRIEGAIPAAIDPQAST